MKTKPFLAGSLLSAIVSFILGYLWYMILFKDMYDNEAARLVMRPESETNVMLIFVGILVGALALTAIYEMTAASGHNVGSGVKLGAIAGLIPGLGYAIMSYATSTMMTGQSIVLESLYGLISYGIMGGLIAFVYSKMDK